MTMLLVIEDDKAVRNLLSTTLETYGYEYRAAANGTDGLKEAVSFQPDIYIIDLGLPDMHGVDLIEKIRTWTDNPIIVVSALSETSDKIAALDMGADDYLTKPFSVDELLARIRVALRKKTYDTNKEKTDTVFINGGLKIDYLAGCVYVDGQEIRLTPIEYKLLTLLAQNAGKVLTHNYILKEVWNITTESDTRSLRVFMATLRKKIEKDPSNPRYLQTHIGIGYRLLRVNENEYR